MSKDMPKALVRALKPTPPGKPASDNELAFYRACIGNKEAERASTFSECQMASVLARLATAEQELTEAKARIAALEKDNTALRACEANALHIAAMYQSQQDAALYRYLATPIFGRCSSLEGIVSNYVPIDAHTLKCLQRGAKKLSVMIGNNLTPTCDLDCECWICDAHVTAVILSVYLDEAVQYVRELKAANVPAQPPATGEEDK